MTGIVENVGVKESYSGAYEERIKQKKTVTNEMLSVQGNNSVQITEDCYYSQFNVI